MRPLNKDFGHSSAKTRLYYGSEFCQHLVPGMDELIEVYQASAERGTGFTFVTPPVTDKGLEKLDTLFALLAPQEKDRTGIEVVVNDWGVLRLLHRKYLELEPVLGRLMNKMLREPRVTPRYNTPDAPREPLQVLRQSSITFDPYSRLLKRFGIGRVELDNLYQDIDIDFKTVGTAPSIHIPYGCVTTGRICFFASLHQPTKRKFTCTTPCRKECREYGAVLTGSYDDRPAGHTRETGGSHTMQVKLLRFGNSVFYRQGRGMIKKALQWAKKNGARVVYRPRPMEGFGYGTKDYERAKQWILPGH